MYFAGNIETIAKINQVPYQVIEYDDQGMFQAKLMDNTQVEIFIDNGATPSILPSGKKAAKISFEDYHLTWSGIATSKSKNSKNPLYYHTR